jgi:hypothetical protein
MPFFSCRKGLKLFHDSRFERDVRLYDHMNIRVRLDITQLNDVRDVASPSFHSGIVILTDPVITQVPMTLH